jgi:hypothetical protein
MTIIPMIESFQYLPWCCSLSSDSRKVTAQYLPRRPKRRLRAKQVRADHGFDTSKAPVRLTLTLALAVVSMVWVTLLEDQIIDIYIDINTWSTQTLRILRVNTRT